MIEINEMIIEFNNTPDNPGLENGGWNDPENEPPEQLENSGTIILDATCATEHNLSARYQSPE